MNTYMTGAPYWGSGLSSEFLTIAQAAAHPAVWENPIVPRPGSELAQDGRRV